MTCLIAESRYHMIIKLDESGFISREPGQSRSIKLLVDREHIGF